MKASFKVNNPDEVEATLTITMRVKEWESIASQVEEGYPGWAFASIVRQMIRSARAVVYPEAERDVIP